MRSFVVFLALFSAGNCEGRSTKLIDGVVRIESETGRCAGVAISPTEVATAAHCVRSGPPEVTTHADEVCTTVDVAADFDNDAALIHVTGCTLVPLPLGRRDPKIGDVVIVVGHPLGEGWAFSEGIVSKVTDEGRLMIDAAVNMGNSGGGVFDRRGRLIGIVSSLLTPSRHGTWSGIGYAAPISRVLDLRDQDATNIP
jgi:serine protease Do